LNGKNQPFNLLADLPYSKAAWAVIEGSVYVQDPENPQTYHKVADVYPGVAHYAARQADLAPEHWQLVNGNALRIMAAVNACRDIPTQTLGNDGVKALIDAAKNLRLAVLKDDWEKYLSYADDVTDALNALGYPP